MKLLAMLVMLVLELFKPQKKKLKINSTFINTKVFNAHVSFVTIQNNKTNKQTN